MKKNVSVNMFGTLYNIDEDAYRLLQEYEDSVRSYFARKGDDGEVAQDVERRVAELCDELCRQGREAITIEDVENMIRRIGQPTEMDDREDTETADESTEPSAGEEKEQEPQSEDDTASKPQSRKLYRDADDCMLGGVLAGLAHYFGGNPTALRLLVVAIGLLGASIPWLIVCYLVACVLVPKAVKPEDKLRMMGKAVNLESLGEKVINGANEGMKSIEPRGCLAQGLGFIATIIKLAMYVCGGCAAIVVGLMLFCILGGALVILASGLLSLLAGSSALWWWDTAMPFDAVGHLVDDNFITMLVAIVLACALPLYCLWHVYRRMRGKEKAWSVLTRVAVLLVWILCVILTLMCGRRTLAGLRGTDWMYNGGLFGTGWSTATYTVICGNDTIVKVYSNGQPVDDSDTTACAIGQPIDDSGAEVEAVSDSVGE